MKTISILLISVLFSISLNAQNTSILKEDSSKLATIEQPSLSNKINSIPQFPGGIKKLSYYLTKNIKYPRNCRTASTRGKVLVSFKVEMDGTISDVNVIKGKNLILNKEAKRVVANMPNWKPALLNGVPKSEMLTIPIVFFRN